MKENPFDVVALVGSAGSHEAVINIISELPRDFPTPIIVMHHLGPESNTAELYDRILPFAAAWVCSGSALQPGTVLVCPGRSFVEILPDGTCVVSPCEQGAVERPMDRFLVSIAHSFGPRAIGVVLTGMGEDGAAGAYQLHLMGGAIVVQSEATAEFARMPRAAIQAGAADLVAPLADIGQVIRDIVAGTTSPQPRSETEAIRQVFGEKGEMATRARQLDWSRTGFGPVREWPPVLRSTVRLAIESPHPVTIFWGPQHLVLMNDAGITLLDGNLPEFIARPAFETWFKTREHTRSILTRVLAGEHVTETGLRIPFRRQNRVGDAWFDLIYTPLHDVNGQIVGVYAIWHSRTAEVLASRRLQLLNALTKRASASNQREALERALAVLRDAPDILFAAAYQIDTSQKRASLVGTAGIKEGSLLAPRTPALTGDIWPLGQVIMERQPLYLDDLATRLPDPSIATNSATLTPEKAVLHPLHDGSTDQLVGVLILGLNPRLLWDDPYREFLGLVAETIEARLTESYARERERERLDQMAELDRAKTEFFANVSHEFRTPLTLLLAPLEDLLHHREELPDRFVREVEVAADNSRRLLRLVNNLLDFSQIEARRQQANFEPTDLCALTTDIASAFRSAIEAAGLKFRVECDTRLPPVWVDPDMWEKIVSNLLSNAFKFTFAGTITVQLNALSLHAELVVKDTGIGIPEQEMPHLFKRFHRVRGARARTVEGSGIGLAIVDDLVKRLGGQLRARSQENRGTEFTVWIPYKSLRVRAEPTTTADAPTMHEFAAALARDASRWAADTQEIPAGIRDDLLGPPPVNGETGQGRLLVVDDNADMRHYLQRLLTPRWQVEVATDGESALKMALHLQPDVILADVMMPDLSGFELMQRIHEDEQLRHIPVVLLTARAGEEAAIQGLLAGADAYIAKPFSPRELVARIQSAVDRARAETALREHQKRLSEELADAKQLQRVSSGLIEADDVATLYEQILDASKAVTRSDMVSMQIFHPESERLYLLVWKGFHPDSAKFWEWVRADTASVCGVALTEGKRIIVPDLEAWDVLQGTADLQPFRLSKIRAVQSTPLISRSGKILGMISNHWTEVHEPSEREMALLDVIARQAADLLERRQAEESVREHQRQLQNLNETLEQKVLEKTAEVRHLASEQVKVTQRERQRISQILHEDLQQRVYAIQLQMTLLRDGFKEERTRNEAFDISNQLHEILQITRNLSTDLSPPILKDQGLKQAIAWLAARMRQQYGLIVELQADGAFALAHEELHVFLFNCVRELLFNVVKHAETNQAIVRLHWEDDGLRIEVQDQGKGFSPQMAGDENGGSGLRHSLGLVTLRHQLALFGGRVQITSEPGAGTEIVLFVPLDGMQLP